MCEHISIELIRKGLLTGLHEGVQRFCGSVGALTVARNGGNELALRSYVLGWIENRSQCFALTEFGSDKHDAALKCASCGETLAVVEFKHNFLKQVNGWVAREVWNATNKLAGTADPSFLSFYVHFVVDLKHHPDSSLARLHNEAVGNRSDKRFLSEDMRKALLPDLERLLESPAFPPCDIFAAGNDKAGAVLHCWVYELRNRNFVPLAVENVEG